MPAGPRAPLTVAAAVDLLGHARTAVLVEGWSDQAALETLARRRALDLQAAGIFVLPIGGITNVGKFAEALGPRGLGVRLCGLCDRAEEPVLMRGLRGAGVAQSVSRAEAEALGFFTCEEDLEDELVRALGPPSVEQLLASQGELDSFRRFQDQPAQRAREVHAQLRRFLGTRAGRKIRYGALLVDAIDPRRMPRPLDLALRHACA